MDYIRLSAIKIKVKDKIIMKIKLESKGKVSIPEQLLEKMGLQEGDSFQIDHTDSGLILTPKKKSNNKNPNSVLVFENKMGNSRFLTIK